LFKGDNMDQLEAHQELIKKLDREKMENSSEATKAKELACQSIELTRYRNERNLMLYPFCSTSKSKRLKSIDYKSADGKRWLLVTANHDFGMVKIWDFDILRFALSKAGEIARITGYFPSSIEFTVYECLKGIKRDPKSGKNITWFREALRRLASTTYMGNVFRDDTKVETGFTLLRYEYIEGKSKEDHGRIKITLDERVSGSARYQNGLLAIDNNVVKEESGIKKRLLELVKISKGVSKEWIVGLERLQQMCAHEGELKKFKSQLKGYDLPWKIEFSKAISGEENIKFFD
jgi:Replication initiator protein A